MAQPPNYRGCTALIQQLAGAERVSFRLVFRCRLWFSISSRHLELLFLGSGMGRSRGLLQHPSVQPEITRVR